jgi:transposase
MPRIAEQAAPVAGGVDTHADVHVAAVVDQVGRVLGTEAFPATAAGYRAALAWMSSHGELVKVGWRAPAVMVPGWPGTWPPAVLRWPR